MDYPHRLNNIVNKANSTLGFLKRNLRFCSKDCRKNSYISLVRSKLDYGSTIYDPYLQQDINKLEKVQRKGARFITQDYNTKEKGCMTKMLKELEFPTLEERRTHQRLALFYKISEGKIPAMPSEDFIQKQPSKRLIKPRKFENHVHSNIIQNQGRMNNKCVMVPRAATEQYKQSFFVKTSVEWNNLENCIVNCSTLDSFKNALKVEHMD